MEPRPNKKAQFGRAQQEHADFKRQCAQFRAHSTELRRSIDKYQELLAALRSEREIVANQQRTPAEIQMQVEAIQQQLWETQIELYELRFEFYDLVAKFKELETAPFPQQGSRF